MAMQWDSVLVGATADELRNELAGARLRGHGFDWDQRRLTLFFRERTLRWHLHPSTGWVVLDPPEELPEEAAPLAAEVVKVEAPPDERVLRLHLRKIRGKVRKIQVVVELMTNQWNALLLEGDGEWIRHILWTRQLPERALASGQAYRPPPPSNREGIRDEVPDSRWAELLRDAGGEEGHRSILARLAFTSSINLPNLLEPSGHTFWRTLRSGTARQPCLLESGRDHQPYPYVINDLNHTPYPSVLEAFRGAFGKTATGEQPDPAIRKGLKKALEQARGRVRGLEREMAQAADPEALRERANLLLARLGEVERGARSVTLRGFSGEDLEVTLDPALSPHENAEALYEEAARRERAAKRLPSLLEKSRAKVTELERMEAGLAEGILSEEEVRSRLPSKKEPNRWTPSDQAPRLPFLRFRSSGGLEIRVGRGSKDNDALTFKHSHPDDVWLHAREAGGAHVVLRWREADAPPGKDLKEAAALAALNSKARSSQTVPVDWTRRKYVRKPRKAPPGTVTIERAKTVFVEPDAGLPDRLAWEG